MRIAIFLSVRLGSTRLPQKALLEIKGKPVIEHLIDRLKMARLPDIIVLCTTTNPDDEKLIEIAKKKGIEYFRGSEKDKIERYYKAAKHFKIDFAAIVDGDDLFCDPEYIDKTIKKFKETNADFITYKSLPLGVRCLGVKTEALEKIYRLKEETDTEIWSGYFTETGLFKVLEYEVEDITLKHPEYRMTLDYKEDFEFFKTIFDKLYTPNKIFTLREIIQLLQKEPWIAKINKDVQKLYEQHLKKTMKPVRLKKKV